MARLDHYHALRFRDLRSLLTGNLIASLGLQMLNLAVGWELYDRTGSALALGIVGLVQVIPVLTLLLVTGQVADRYNRKVALLLCPNPAGPRKLRPAGRKDGLLKPGHSAD
jgi:MFS family permease